MAKKKNELSLNYKVERSNELNKLVPKGWNLTEIRFLAIYQAKINARNPESRVVTFPLETFCEIMEIKRLNITQMKETVSSLLSKPVFLPNGKNGFIGIPLFVECEVLQDDKTNEWLVKIECHQKAMSYMFEMKRNYFTYELWNALNLSSVNQIRMYEILKQYEKIGSKIIEVDELKTLLGIEKSQYSSFKDFRVRVLESCQKALEQHTDIRYTFEPIRRGRKIHALKFTITKNKDFKDNLRLKEFIKPEDLEDIKDIANIPDITTINTPDTLLANAKVPSSANSDIDLVWLSFDLDDAYSMSELENLVKIARSISDNPEAYLKTVYYQIKARQGKISNLYSYTLSVINSDLKNVKPKENKKSYGYDDDDDKPSYNLDAYIENLHKYY